MTSMWRDALPRSRVSVIALMLLSLAGCDLLEKKKKEGSAAPPQSPTSGGQVGLPLGPPVDHPEPRAGMAYIPPGALVVGTAPDKRPRRADRELPGHQVMLDGFYIDYFAFPNEEGAIPQTNVTREEAEVLCLERGKRLCTELEWERACKGPDNRTYEYGEAYREDTCRTGRPAQLRPSGFHVGCQSDFGVRDMHGGPFEWTAGAYGRGKKGDFAPLRGGNSVQGEVVGRCANVEPEGPSVRSGTLGFRCCSGEVNSAEVTLEMNHAAGLIPQAQFDPEIERSLIGALPEEAQKTLVAAGQVTSQRVWLWRPISNEEIHLIALCGRGKPNPRGPRCGLFLARVAPGNVQGLAWVSSGEWVPNLHRLGPHEMLWLIGGDRRGNFKRLITYHHGDVDVGPVSQGVPKPGK